MVPLIYHWYYLWTSMKIKIVCQCRICGTKGHGGHTSVFMATVTGGTYVQSRKRKLNITSSNKTKLARVDNVLTQAICTQYFLKEQRYEVHDNIIYQDSKSAMKLEKNVRQSSIKWTCHINTRYYFITDRLKMMEAYVKFFPTSTW